MTSTQNESKFMPFPTELAYTEWWKVKCTKCTMDFSLDVWPQKHDHLICPECKKEPK